MLLPSRAARRWTIVLTARFRTAPVTRPKPKRPWQTLLNLIPQALSGPGESSDRSLVDT
jgi:hypothetical protein